METGVEKMGNGNVSVVLWPEIIKVSCRFTEAAGKTHGKYQIYWNTPEEPGPYTVQLLTDTQVLAEKTQVYGTGSSLEADIPEKASCYVTVFPDQKEAKNKLPVPGEPVCRLQEIKCEAENEDGLCNALRLRYEMGSIVPEKVIVQLRFSDSGVRLIPLAPFEGRISLENLGLDDVESVQLGMGCTYKEQSAVIDQEPAEETLVDVCRKAPALTGMSVEMKKQQTVFRIDLAGEGTGSFEAVFSCAEARTKAEAELSADKKSLSVQVSLSDFPYGPEQDYLMSVIQKDGMVTFLESEKLAVNLQKPTVETLRRVNKDTFRLKLAGQADTRPQVCRAFLKDADGNIEAVDFAGGELEHAFASWESVTFAWVNGKSIGPGTDSISLKIPAYLSAESKAGFRYIYYAEDGRSEPGGSIRAEITVKAVLQNQVQSGAFTLLPPAQAGDKGAVLEMADTVWPDNQNYDSETIKTDWLSLLKKAEAAGFDGEDLRELRKVAAQRLPQRTDVSEQAFYRFDMRRRQCGLFPGMALLVESGRMQWSDDPVGSGYFVGISGAEQIRIPVVCRDRKIGLDSFLCLLEDYAERFDQPDKVNEGKLRGGAGTVDLGREGLRQTHLIVHYPENFISHWNQGAVHILKNEYLAAAESLEIMDRDVALLELQGYLDQREEGSQAYFVFLRGRVHMTPCFALRMEGGECWVTVGTTVGDMMDRYGKSFYLLRDGVKAEAPMVEKQALREICLAPGDSLCAEE